MPPNKSVGQLLHAWFIVCKLVFNSRYEYSWNTPHLTLVLDNNQLINQSINKLISEKFVVKRLISSQNDLNVSDQNELIWNCGKYINLSLFCISQSQCGDGVKGKKSESEW